MNRRGHLQAWGNIAQFDGEIDEPAYLHELYLNENKANVSVFAQGRSYGDVALPNGQAAIATSKLNRIISVDWARGIIRAESGVTLEQLIELSMPNGWFLSVTPGTKYVSLGGAIANDVHGKNQHQVGCFGNFVISIGLLRSDGEVLILSKDENSELFSYTISGLGLTGVILWAEIQLTACNSAYFDVENIPYNSIEQFFELSNDSREWPYTVAWVDCFAEKKQLGRGVFTRARHHENSEDTSGVLRNKAKRLSIPCYFPEILMNKHTIKIFNKMYSNRPGASYRGEQYYDSFLYPLDSIEHWNKLYGKRGFYQYQVVIPIDSALEGMRRLLATIEKSGIGSFLAVLKVCGSIVSPGKNSFPFEGISLALDFPNTDDKTLRLFEELDAITKANGGRLYPAKDNHMSAELYRASYPNWKRLEELRDPMIMTRFWNRVAQ